MMRVNLLSENDWKTLSAALRRMDEITLTRTLGDEKITAQTRPAGHPWTVAAIVQIRYENRYLVWVQNFESVEEARRRT